MNNFIQIKCSQDWLRKAQFILAGALSFRKIDTRIRILITIHRRGRDFPGERDVLDLVDPMKAGDSWQECNAYAPCVSGPPS